MTRPSDLTDHVPIERSKQRRNGWRGMQISGAIASGEGGARAAFYAQGDRPTPSLPKLRFLEGKD